MKNDINKANKEELTSSNKKELGRPKKELDEDIIANLAQIGCTQEEIASVVGISARTLQRHHAELIKENKNKGRSSLRKKLWSQAMKGNPNLLVWLSKNELGMKDRTITEIVNEPLPLIINAKAEDIDEEKE